MIHLLLFATSLPCGENRAFIDLGANDGQSLQWFGKHWATQNKINAVTAFEMNGVFADPLRQLLKPWNGALEAAAAWTVDGDMPANMQQIGSRTSTKGGVLYNMTSSALAVGGVPLNKQAKQHAKKRGAHERTVSVRTVDFSRWLSQRYCPADRVDVKMDIEGAEVQWILNPGARCACVC